LTLAAAAVMPFDAPVARAMAELREGTGGVRLGGDVRRELEALQQFGQGTFSVLIALAIVLLDRRRSRRLVDWGLAAGVTALLLYPAKMLIGRPRPKFDDPFGFTGPFGAYPLGPGEGVRAGWDLSAGDVSDLWAMPSGHTAYAVVCAVFLAVAYPRVWPLAVVLAGLTATGRVVLGAHYPSDVLVGAMLGVAVTVPVVRRYMGVRGLDWVWRRAVDRRAAPAFDGLHGACERSA
jgi:membrane-associated phospholipid phosphatase